MLTRVVKHVPCEYCKGHDPVACIICGGTGYVELAVWKEVPDEAPDEAREGGEAEVAEGPPQRE